MRYDVTYKRMGGESPSHLLHFCANIETAVALTREQYPGCLIIEITALE